MSRVARYRAFLVELLVVTAGVTGLGFAISKGFAAHRKPAEEVMTTQVAPAPAPEPIPEPVPEEPKEEPAAEPAPPPAPAIVVPAGPPPLTSLPLTLVATNVARDAKYSTAVIDDRFYGAMAYGVADHLPGGGPIVAISGRYVDFQNRRSGRVERLDLLGESVPAPAPEVARASAPVRAAAPADDLATEVDNAVSKKDDTHYTVSRAFVDKVLANPMVMMGTLRARPTAEGLKISGVKEGSPASKIGLRQGDVITALNGHETAGGNLDKMLELYSKLKSASSLSVQIKRGGQPMSLEYAIQ